MKIALIKTTDRASFAWTGEAWEPVAGHDPEAFDVVELRPLSGLEVIAAQAQATEDPARVIGDTLTAAVVRWNGGEPPPGLVASLPVEPLTALFEAWQAVQTGPLSGAGSASDT